MSVAKRVGFWGVALIFLLTALATIFWALDYLVVQSAPPERSTRFLGIFGIQAALWGFVLFMRRGWRTAQDSTLPAERA